MSYHKIQFMSNKVQFVSKFFTSFTMIVVDDAKFLNSNLNSAHFIFSRILHIYI
jgi:hypothetical protein